VSYLILWVAVFTRQACLPVPANLFLLTAGALVRGGELNMMLVLVVAVLGLVAVIGIPLAFYVARRVWLMVQMLQMLRNLRLRRITHTLLHKKIRSAEHVAIVDLLSFEEGPEGHAGIPGAVRMDPARLRSRIRVVVPENLGIVLYCSSSGELTSARVAVALQKIGISNVWVLEGGLAAWKKEGFPVTVHLSTSREVTERFGIKIIEMDSGATL
jgi:rhodanese-related sulfurtransferase